MITTADGNTYSMQGFFVNTNTGSVQATYEKTNPAAAEAGFKAETISLEIGGMPAVKAAFADPVNVGLPLFPAYEQWLVSDHGADGQDHLQFLTGGTINA